MKSWLLAFALLAAAGGAMAQDAGCQAAPLGARPLYLRGSFNSWAAAEAQRFTWACKRYDLVTRIEGEHVFKLGDEGWSADADFGTDADSAQRLALRGREIRQRFAGLNRISVTMNDPLHLRRRRAGRVPPRRNARRQIGRAHV